MRRAQLVAIIVVIAAVWTGVGAALSGGVVVDGEIEINSPDGPQVDLYGDGNQYRFDGPSGSNSVTIISDSNGDYPAIRLESPAAQTALLDPAGEPVFADETTIDEITTDAPLTIYRSTSADNPPDGSLTPDATIDPDADGELTKAAIRNVELNDGEYDVKLPTTSGAKYTYYQFDRSEIPTDRKLLAAVRSDTAGSNAGEVVATSELEPTGPFGGKVTLGLPVETRESQATYDIVWLAPPEINNGSASPAGGATPSDDPVRLRINVSDPDFPKFQNDEVTVEFYNGNGTQVGSDTLTENRTATTTVDGVITGTNEWYAVATDETGLSTQSQTFTYEAPDQLIVRDLTTDEIIDQSGNVSVQFFGSDGAVQTETTNTGTINLLGLPADQRYSVTVETDGYQTRQAIIDSLIDQQTVYLLPNTTDTVQPRFFIEDPTDQFSKENTEIIFKRPLNTSSGTEFVAVAGDRIGLNGFTTTLEQGQRYRVIVRNPDTDARRELGEFTATTSEEVTFTVEDIQFDSVSDVEGIKWTARYLTNEDQNNDIQFIYRDSQPIQQLEYRIVERGNEQNVLVNSTSAGNVTVSETVPPGDENTVWVVEWTATREDGETLSASRPVSANQLPVGPGLDSRWQTIITIIGLFAVAGLFGAVNPGVGGIAVAATGGMFFLIGWLPDSTGGIMVLLALFVAVLAYAGRRARGATA